MATNWIGGNPNEPDYYISVSYSEVKNSILKRIFTKEKTSRKKIVSIITSSKYYSLSKDEKSSYKGMTIRDVQEHGTEEFKKQLPEAEAHALGRIIGMPF